MWTQPTFLNGGSTENLTVDSGSTLEIYGKNWPSGFDGRVILRDGNTFYISDTNLGGGTGNETVGLIREWVVYNPTSNLQFTGSSFSQHTFTNITGAGIYFYGFALSGTSLSFSEQGFAANLSAPYLPADVNHDGVVNGLDISLISSNWLKTGLQVPDDANGDQVVNGLDIALVSSSWLQSQGAGATSGAALPEPATHLLLGMGAIVLAFGGWRRARASR